MIETYVESSFKSAVVLPDIDPLLELMPDPSWGGTIEPQSRSMERR